MGISFEEALEESMFRRNLFYAMQDTNLRFASESQSPIIILYD